MNLKVAREEAIEEVFRVLLAPTMAVQPMIAGQLICQKLVLNRVEQSQTLAVSEKIKPKPVLLCADCCMGWMNGLDDWIVEGDEGRFQ